MYLEHFQLKDLPSAAHHGSRSTLEVQPVIGWLTVILVTGPPSAGV